MNPGTQLRSPQHAESSVTLEERVMGQRWGRCGGGLGSGFSLCLASPGDHVPNTSSDLCAFPWLTVGSPDTFPRLHPFPFPTSALSEAEILFISELLKVPQKLPIAQRTGWVWNRLPPAALAWGLLSPQAPLGSATLAASGSV